MTHGRPPEDVLAAVAGAAGRIGCDGFHDSLLSAVERLVPADDAQVIAYPGDAAPVYLHVRHTEPAFRERYLHRFWPFDPFRRRWARSAGSGVLPLAEVAHETRDEGRYFREFFDPSYGDELGVLLPGFGRSGVGLFVQRRGRFTTVELAALRALFPLLRQLHRAHRRAVLDRLRPGAYVTGTPLALADRSGTLLFATRAWHEAGLKIGDSAAPGLEVTELPDRFALAPGGRLLVGRRAAAKDVRQALASFLEGGLSRRERQIVELGFAGHGSASIARALGLTESTVKFYRRRLYRKLDITTERELVAMFLAHAGADSSPT